MAHKFFIAGVQHHQMGKVLNELEVDDDLLLIPEPTNKFDPNAVKIVYGTLSDDIVMLGYVPKKFSSAIAGLLEVGETLYCRITKLDKTAKPWEQCEVEILSEEELDSIDEVEDAEMSDEEFDEFADSLADEIDKDTY